MMKNRFVPITAAIILAMSVLPVSAGDLSNTEPAGNTEVTANVSNNGDVAYLISIPDKVNFGALQQPRDNTTEHPATRNYTVEAVQINGLDTTTSRVAVLLKDPARSGGFQITGQSTANSGKILEYSIHNQTGANITEGKQFTNGYLLVAFESAGQSVSGQLKLDQNQLYGKELDDWAGSYMGTINFYSRVASLEDVQ